MKLSINTDFTKFSRAGKVVRAHDAANLPVPFDLAVLPHDERRMRRRAVELVHGDKILVELTEPVVLEHGDRLILDDGRNVEIIAAEEELYEVRAGNRTPLSHLAWHLGGRHVAAQIEEERILIGRNHDMRDLLVGLGATVAEISEPFQPLDSVHQEHGRRHAHDHHGHGHHDHGHGERDKFGRLPGDPHYGHNHA